MLYSIRVSGGGDYFLQAEDGPWDVVIRLRQFVGEGFLGRLLDPATVSSAWHGPTARTPSTPQSHQA
jgi:hypothetical protein